MTVDNRAWAALGLLALIWSSSFLAAEIALTALGPLTLVTLRLGGAAAALWLVLALTGTRGPRGREWGALAVMGLLNNALPFMLITWGQTGIESGLAAILNATTALFGALVCGLLLPDERLTRRRGAGVLLGLCGVAAAVGPGALAGFDLRDLAQIAVLGAALSYAFASVWARLRLGGVAPLAAAAGMTLCATLWIAPVALTVEGIPARIEPGAAGAALWLALPCTAGAYVLYYRVLALAGAANLMLVTMMIPPMAILWGALALGERLSPGAFLGMGLIMAGLAVIDGRAPAWMRRARG